MSISLHRPESALAGDAAPTLDRREAVLRAALELFAERTYGATAVPDIAARAHVGTGTIYRHFPGKEALANEVYRRCKARMHDSVRRALESATEPKARFLALWSALTRLAHEDPVMLRFLELQHHEEYLDAESRMVRERLFEMAGRFVRESQAAGAMREGDPIVLIALVFGAFVGLFKEAVPSRSGLDTSALAPAGETVWKMIAAG